MSSNLSMNDLIRAFKQAKESDAEYIAVFVRMKDLDDNEIIINTKYNMDEKLKYYKQTYTSDLTHKLAGDDVKIVGFTFRDTLSEIELDYLDGGFF